MSREYVGTEFDCRRISVIVHRSASNKLAVVHSSCVFGAESYSGPSSETQEQIVGARERLNGRKKMARRIENRRSLLLFSPFFTALLETNDNWCVNIDRGIRKS